VTIHHPRHAGWPGFGPDRTLGTRPSRPTGRGVGRAALGALAGALVALLLVPGARPVAHAHLRGDALATAAAPIVTFSVAGSYTVGSPGSVNWSFAPPAGAGYEGWSEAWDTTPTSPSFTTTAGWLGTQSLSPGTHHVVLAFFFAGQPPVVVDSPTVTIRPPHVDWNDPGTVTNGSTTAVSWSFTAPASPGYLGWSQAFDSTPTSPTFTTTSGWLSPGSLTPGLHHVVLAFFFSGQPPVVVTSPPIAVVATSAPVVQWSAPATATAGQSGGSFISWSFAPPNLPGYRGWSQSWNSPASAPTFTSTSGWLDPSGAAPGEESALVTFFDGSGTVVEASPSVDVAPPPVTFTVSSSYTEGQPGNISWSFPDAFGDGYEGWSQSYDAPGNAPTFQGGGGWEPGGVLSPGTHQVVVTFFWANRPPVAVASPTFTVNPLPVSWSTQSSYVEDTGAEVSWSFPPPTVVGYEGWTQSFDQPGPSPSFTTGGGWLVPGSEPAGTQRVFLTFFTAWAPPFVVESPPLTVRPDYQAGATGYDISFPQCGGPYPAGPHTVAIVGVNWGTAFSQNPCLASEAAWAGSGLNLYLNVNQPSPSDPSKPSKKTTSREMTGPEAACAASGSSQAALCQAYDYGWNDAQYGLNYAASQGVQASVWWLDVECPATSCGWSSTYWSTNLALNAAVIQGALNALQMAGAAAGVYSTTYQWGAIAGTATPGVPVWYAGWSASASYYCSAGWTEFTGGPVWLVQQDPSETGDQFDPDTAC